MKKLTKEQLDRFRQHVEQYPIGDIAQLLGHIDYLQRYIDKVDDILSDLPVVFDELYEDDDD